MRIATGNVLPSATTSCVKSIFSAGTAPIFLLPEVTSVTVPLIGAPALATRRPSTTRSDASSALTTSPSAVVFVE